MLGIVFPALPDLESQKGDRRLSNQSFNLLRGTEAGIQGDCEQDESNSRISYSVSYFNWSVSDQSSGGEDDEVENVTLQLDRVKIRRNRSENLIKRTLDKNSGK